LFVISAKVEKNNELCIMKYELFSYLCKINAKNDEKSTVIHSPCHPDDGMWQQKSQRQPGCQ
jgi:hypothetical protein